jgi:hypothetical protein
MAMTENSKKPKSIILTIVLTLLFGPFGMFYVSFTLGLLALLVFTGISVCWAVVVVNIVKSSGENSRNLISVGGLVLLLYYFVGQPWWAATKAKALNIEIKSGDS